MSISETINVDKWLMINEIINYMNKYREKLETIKTSGSKWNLENGRQNVELHSTSEKNKKTTPPLSLVHAHCSGSYQPKESKT